MAQTEYPSSRPKRCKVTNWRPGVARSATESTLGLSRRRWRRRLIGRAARNIQRPQLFGVRIHLVEFILQLGLHSVEFSGQFNQLIDLRFLAVGIGDDIHRRGHLSVACEDGRLQVHRHGFTIGCCGKFVARPVARTPRGCRTYAAAVGFLSEHAGHGERVFDHAPRVSPDCAVPIQLQMGEAAAVLQQSRIRFIHYDLDGLTESVRVLRFLRQIKDELSRARVAGRLSLS